VVGVWTGEKSFCGFESFGEVRDGWDGWEVGHKPRPVFAPVMRTTVGFLLESEDDMVICGRVEDKVMKGR